MTPEEEAYEELADPLVSKASIAKIVGVTRPYNECGTLTPPAFVCHIHHNFLDQRPQDPLLELNRRCKNEVALRRFADTWFRWCGSCQPILPP